MSLNLSRRGFLQASGSASTALFTYRAAANAPASLTDFRPGQPWLDTAGRPLQVHGGSILKVGNTFYWYGENKERSIPGSNIWGWGMRIYASRDLYNWDDLGYLIPPVLNDPKSPFAPTSFADRPHIIHHKPTGKFICWIKIMHQNDWSQTRTVLIADTITGPYRTLTNNLKPIGMNAGDFDLVTAPDGKAYMYFERVHTELICADLTDDYTNLTGYYSSHFPKTQPPFTREAPAYFVRNGKHYLFTSGTTGYYPNPTEVASADTFHGPWKVLGDAHPRDYSRTSYGSQISSVFKHPAKQDLYIALADRWIYDLASNQIEGQRSALMSTKFQGYYEKRFAPGGSKLSIGEQKIVQDIETSINLSLARYVWLPISFDGDRPFIVWRESWSLDEFE